MLPDPRSDLSLLLQQASNDDVPAISCFCQVDCKGGDGSQGSPLSLRWPWVEIRLIAAEWGESSTSPLASTHTTLTAPEVFVTTPYVALLAPSGGEIPESLLGFL